ncbi:MAG: cupin domain-containing protein [Pseudomonadota bacterium]
MASPIRIDPRADTVGFDREGRAQRLPAEPDPPTPFAGLVVGFAEMRENAPHNGERHPDGDEFLLLISGRVRVVFENPAIDDVDVNAGDGLIVPAGEWHRVDILEPCRIVYLTPGPNNEFRPL